MTRILMCLTATLTFALAGLAAAQDAPAKSPCWDKETGAEIEACLGKILKETPDATIIVPVCEPGSAGPDEACVAKGRLYQKILAKLTGKPCAGLDGARLERCEQEQAADADESGSGGRKSLEKHEGTRMERLDEDE